MTKKQIIGCIIGGLIIFCGFVGSIIYLVLSVLGTMGEGNRILVPGEVVIDLQEPGDYVIYHEFVSNYEGRIFNQQPGQFINGLYLEVIEESSNKVMKLQQTELTANYQISSRQGVSILRFTIEDSGKYLIKATYPDGKGNEAVINIQQSILKSLLNPLLTMFAILGGSLIVGTGIILFSVFKYKKKV